LKRKFDPAEPEWMDRPQPVSPELVADLENLRALNRYFGSYRLVRYFLERWLRPNDNLRILDLATGSGDIPRLIASFAREIGATVTIDAVDFQASTIAIATEQSIGYPEISFHCADIHSFGAERTYDLVLCSLALHHFSEKDAIRLLRHAVKLSRKKVMVADLRRSWPAKVGIICLTTLVFREPMTRNDGRVSMERAFSFRELAHLATVAGWQNFGHRRFRFARQAIWLEHAPRE
jgi:2-polyprenyl-3-methyl-5-hydroxy-6-metoxy-1,4-benzoquinol methylase